MNVNVQISLSQDEDAPALTPEEMLVALGGDPTKDTIGVSTSAAYTPPPPEAKEA
jgi:hypothetical protein